MSSVVLKFFDILSTYFSEICYPDVEPVDLFNLAVVLLVMDALPFLPQLSLGGAEDFFGETGQTQGSRNCDQNQKHLHTQNVSLSFLTISFANSKMIQSQVKTRLMNKTNYLGSNIRNIRNIVC